MNESTMPATEAAVDPTDEVVSYELAFHVLPTVAEGEVARVEEALTDLINEAGGTVSLREAAQRFELAYELTKYIDGKYRRFTNSYFGWIRFSADPAAVEGFMHEVEAQPAILRSLLVRLTRREEAHPFYIHEALATGSQIETIDLTETPSEEVDESDEMAATKSETDDAAESTDADAPDAERTTSTADVDTSVERSEVEDK